MSSTKTSPPLTREMLLDDSYYARMHAADPEIPLVALEQHRRSIRALLDARPDSGAGRNDVWMFAYGSLIWNPMIEFLEQRIGTVHGYHRRFCLWTKLGRGSVERPGLLLGIDRGGSCRGVAFRIAEAKAPEELEILWRREMVTGAYDPQWVKVRSDQGMIHAIAFLINRRHPRYAGLLPEDQVVETVARASGVIGPCADYLFNTVEHLEKLGIHDRALRQLRNLVSERRRQLVS